VLREDQKYYVNVKYELRDIPINIRKQLITRQSEVTGQMLWGVLIIQCCLPNNDLISRSIHRSLWHHDSRWPLFGESDWHIYTLLVGRNLFKLPSWISRTLWTLGLPMLQSHYYLSWNLTIMSSRVNTLYFKFITYCIVQSNFPFIISAHKIVAIH